MQPSTRWSPGNAANSVRVMICPPARIPMHERCHPDLGAAKGAGRSGLQGLSYAYCMDEPGSPHPSAPKGRLIHAHPGNGAHPVRTARMSAPRLQRMVNDGTGPLNRPPSDPVCPTASSAKQVTFTLPIRSSSSGCRRNRGSAPSPPGPRDWTRASAAGVGQNAPPEGVLANDALRATVSVIPTEVELK